jgi:hypothetical protein
MALSLSTAGSLPDVCLARAILQKYRPDDEGLADNLIKLEDLLPTARFRAECAERLTDSPTSPPQLLMTLTLLGLDLIEPKYVLWAIETLLHDGAQRRTRASSSAATPKKQP